MDTNNQIENSNLKGEKNMSKPQIFNLPFFGNNQYLDEEKNQIIIKNNICYRAAQRLSEYYCANKFLFGSQSQIENLNENDIFAEDSEEYEIIKEISEYDIDDEDENGNCDLDYAVNYKSYAVNYKSDVEDFTNYINSVLEKHPDNKICQEIMVIVKENKEEYENSMKEVSEDPFVYAPFTHTKCKEIAFDDFEDIWEFGYKLREIELDKWGSCDNRVPRSNIFDLPYTKEAEISDIISTLDFYVGTDFSNGWKEVSERDLLGDNIITGFFRFKKDGEIMTMEVWDKFIKEYYEEYGFTEGCLDSLWDRFESDELEFVSGDLVIDKNHKLFKWLYCLDSDQYDPYDGDYNNWLGEVNYNPYNDEDEDEDDEQNTETSH